MLFVNVSLNGLGSLDFYDFVSTQFFFLGGGEKWEANFPHSCQFFNTILILHKLFFNLLTNIL